MEPKWLLATFLIFFCIMIPTNLSISMDQNLNTTRNLRVLIFYNSARTSSVVSAHQFQEMLNQSTLVELWDITANPFPKDVAVLRNSSLVVLDGGIDYYDLDSDQRTAIWSALYDGTPFFFNYRNAKVYYDKFGVINSWNRTNYVRLNHNHQVLAPNFLYPAGTGWYSLRDIDDEANSFRMNTSALPPDHKILLECNNTKGEFSFPMVIYGTYGDGKFAVVTGRKSELESTGNYGMLWIVPRITHWLLPDHQPLRRYWSYLSVAFRDDDLGGVWAGSLEDQVSNMSMALSWGIPLTWAFACEEYGRAIWSDSGFIMKLRELEEAGHEIFLHSGGYAAEWRDYNYSEAKAKIQELTENYVQVLGHTPRGWVTPQHGYSDTIVQVLEDLGFKFDSENRKNVGTTLLNGEVIDVSAMYHADLNLNAYKDYVDRVWLFGGRMSAHRMSSPRILVFNTHFYNGDLDEIDLWIEDFKIFLSNYPHRWITLDELAYNVHGQPHARITQMTSRGNAITVKVDSTVETTFFLELKNSTISHAIVDGGAHFRSNSAVMIRVRGETEIVLEVGTPKDSVRVIYSDNPPVNISFVGEELAVGLLASQGRNVTVQINIPYEDDWSINSTETNWGKRWDSATLILTVWTVSDGSFTITVHGLKDGILPEANAGLDQIVDEDTLVVLDGSGSWDNVGIVSYIWTLIDVTPKTLTGVNPTYTFEMPGEYTITLNVTDAAGNWNTDTVLITVLDVTSPTISVPSPENMTYAATDVPFTFTVSESTDWIGYSLDGQANVTITGNMTLTTLPDGIHHVVVYANDTVGNMGASSTVYFTVDTIPPSITSVSQTPESDVQPYQTVKVTVNVTDLTSGVESVILIYYRNRTIGIGFPLIFNSTTRLYVTQFGIPGHQEGTFVRYEIEACDNAGNCNLEDNNGQYYVYTVVPEFPSFLILPLFMITTLLAVIVFKRKRSTN